jgi:hypothetical protein
MCRRQDFWTSGKLPEVNYYEAVPEHPQGSFLADNRSLWEIGNRWVLSGNMTG